MKNFIDQIEISNFKSIRHLKLTGSKRINLLLGRPNVGKSNLLEALSLFGLPYVWEGSGKITDVIRVKNLRELFYEGNFFEDVLIRVRRSGDAHVLENCFINFDIKTDGVKVDISSNEILTKSSAPILSHRVTCEVDQKFKLSNYSARQNQDVVDYIKPYVFNLQVKYKEHKNPFLYPPFGNNLLYVLELMPELRQLYAQWFRQYGLRLVLDTASQSLKIQKEKGDEVFQLPYSSIADTLQRIIFYKTAVASNHNSVLLFEEPEAHAYPPYISEFTQEVIRSATNQFFIVTHSPLIVEQFLSGALDDLGIFMVDFEDGQTVVKGLSTDEIKEVYRYGIDLFFNGESYTA